MHICTTSTCIYKHQGRSQDLSEGGARFFRNKKFEIWEQKSAAQAKNFFDLNESKLMTKD